MKFLKGFLIALLVIIGILIVFKLIGIAVDSHYQKLLRAEAEKAKIVFEHMLNRTYQPESICETPLDENSFKYYKPYFKTIKRKGRYTVNRPIPGEIVKLLTPYFRNGKLDPGEARDAITKMQVFLEAMGKAGCCTRYSIAHETKYNGILTELVYNALSVLKGEKFLLYASSYEFLTGETDQGVNTLLLSLRISEDMSTPGLFLLDELISLAIYRMIYTHIIAAASSNLLNEKQVDTLIKGIQKLGFKKKFFINSIKNENGLPYYEGASRPCIRLTWGFFGENGIPALCYLNFWRDYFSYKRTFWKAGRTATTAIAAFVRYLDIPYQEGESKVEKDVDQVLRRDYILKDIAPNAVKIYQTYKTEQFLRNLSLLSLALRKYYLENKEYPETLEGIENSINTDPLTGKPFIYKKLSKEEAEILLPMYLPDNSDDIKIRLCNCPYETSLKEKLKFYKEVEKLRTREMKK